MKSVPTPSTDTTVHQRRRRVGWISAGSLLVGAAGLVVDGSNSVWGSACIRVGIVLGALWLCLPTETSRVAWSGLSRQRLALIILVAVVFQRIRFFLPAFAVLGLILWAVRPKRRQN